MAELHVLRRVVEQLALDVAEAEAQAMTYRELLQVALSQAQALEAENYRLRASRTAQAAMERAVLA